MCTGCAYARVNVLLQFPQVLQNASQGHTGVQSLVTAGMNLAGSAARLGTSLSEGLAPVVVYGYVASNTLNAVVMAQILVYSRATAAVLAVQAKKPKAE